MESTLKKRKLYEDFLGKITLLEHLDKWERLTIADALEEVMFEEGETVFRKGDEGESFFIIFEGSAKVTEIGEAREEKQLVQYDYFGEVSLLHRRPRTATV